MSELPPRRDPDSSEYAGPRCPRCNGPCTIWFGPAPGFHCPVCHDTEHSGEYRVYCAVTVQAAHAEHAQAKVIDALTAVGRAVTAEPAKRKERR